MKDKLKMRNVNAITVAICLAATIMFSSCSKEDKTIPVSGVTMTMTTSKASVWIDLQGSGTVTIYWGDGTSAITDTLSTTYWTDYIHSYSGSSTRTITIIGENITGLDCGHNQLTTLDVSKNTALTELYCWYNQLTALDVSKNTALANLSCFNNQLTATALNTLFGTLHGNTISGGKNIYIGGNSGTATCDRSIAENKGWTVDTTTTIN